ncbi:MAG: DUF4097 family beta strand repeat-containing protein [Candidatus Latescibacterota bacterium]
MANEERLTILKLLSEGKITVEEAERLLKAVGGQPGEETRGFGRRERWRPRDAGEVIEEIRDEVRRAVRSVQGSEIGRTVSQEVGRAVGSLQRMEVGRMVGEIVDQVREAVGEAVEGAGARRHGEEREWTLDGAGLTRLVVETTSGEVTVTGGDAAQVHVRARKRVRARTEEEAADFAREVVVQAVREGEVVRVFKEHPAPPRGVSVEVGFAIECPRRLDAELQTVNGNVQCTGLEGDLQLRSTNGNVRLAECRGRVEAHTRNGNVGGTVAEIRTEGIFTTANGNVQMALAAGAAPVTATSTNGNVELQLPAGFSGHLDAKTTNGRALCEVPLARTEQDKRTAITGDLGQGGQVEVRLHTLNGNVRVRQASAPGTGGETGRPGA